MLNVMYGSAGTANVKIKLPPVRIAGKTGTAETAAKLRTKVLGEDGKPVKVKTEIRDAKGNLLRIEEKTQYHFYDPVSPQNRSGAPSWYRGFGPDGKKLKHAWFIGYAPADKPQVAFAVMVEYGGSGGFSALSVASGALEACIKHKYLQADSSLAIQQ
jgi:cell division protein FtsI/penicillin-binding protein 2